MAINSKKASLTRTELQRDTAPTLFIKASYDQIKTMSRYRPVNPSNALFEVKNMSSQQHSREKSKVTAFLVYVLILINEIPSSPQAGYEDPLQHRCILALLQHYGSLQDLPDDHKAYGLTFFPAYCTTLLKHNPRS